MDLAMRPGNQSSHWMELTEALFYYGPGSSHGIEVLLNGASHPFLIGSVHGEEGTEDGPAAVQTVADTMDFPYITTRT